MASRSGTRSVAERGTLGHHGREARRRMKRVLQTAVVATALLAGGLAHSSTSVQGIPGDCQMKVHRAKVDPTGKLVGEVATLAENKMIGMWTPRAFRRSWDGRS